MQLNCLCINHKDIIKIYIILNIALPSGLSPTRPDEKINFVTYA